MNWINFEIFVKISDVNKNIYTADVLGIFIGRRRCRPSLFV